MAVNGGLDVKSGATPPLPLRVTYAGSALDPATANSPHDGPSDVYSRGAS